MPTCCELGQLALRFGCGSAALRQLRVGTTRGPVQAGFTLIEMLVVIAIIGILAAVALPRIGGFGKSNATIAASQQLLDDVAAARSRAIASRSDVYMVFVPGAAALRQNSFFINLPTRSPAEGQLITNLLAGQFTTYALYAERNVGDQPGVRNPRYLTAWKTLAQGTFIATNKFGLYVSTDPDEDRRFRTRAFPFPSATNTALMFLPYIAFDHQGKVISDTDKDGQFHDAVLPLARGSIFYERDANGHLVSPFTPDVLENPPKNSSRTNTMWNYIHIDWLTGRARVERQEVQ